jgi:hypothetical protein
MPNKIEYQKGYVRQGASPVGNLAALATARKVRARMMDFMMMMMILKVKV